MNVARWVDTVRSSSGEGTLVLFRGHVVGGFGPSTLTPSMWAAWSATSLDIRVFLEPEQALRWIALRARPVVYHVRPRRSSAGITGWYVIGPDVSAAVTVPLGRSDGQRVLAMTIAHHEAARTLRLRGIA